MNNDTGSSHPIDSDRQQRGYWYYVTQIPLWFSAVALFVLMVMTFSDVVLRSTFDNPIESATELTRLLMAIIVFASLPSVSWNSQHIAVDLLDRFYSHRAAHLRDIAIDLFCGFLLLWPAYRVWELANRTRDYGEVTEYLGFPQYIVGWFIAFFTIVTSVVYIIRGLTRLTTAQSSNANV